MSAVAVLRLRKHKGDPMSDHFSCLRAVAVRLAVCAAVLPLHALAADPANLDGMWKLAAPQTSFQPEGGSIPFNANGRKRYQENKKLKAQGKVGDFDYFTARCASPGLPRAMIAAGRLRFWQRPNVYTIQFEWNRIARQIDMGGLIPQKRVGAGSGRAFGAGGDDDALVGRPFPISKGKWEGDTLVVTTEGFPGNTLVDEFVPHGFDMKLTERIRLRDQDTLEDQITIEDPEFFAKPWKTVVTYKRAPDEAFPESVCLDNLKLDNWPASGKGR
jgi:hypothetical protein